MFNRSRWRYPTVASALPAWVATLRVSVPTGKRYHHIILTLVADREMTQLREADLWDIQVELMERWTGRGSRNRARTALRSFLLWAIQQGAGYRLTPTIITTLLAMEPRPSEPVTRAPTVAVSQVRDTLEPLPLRTQALVALQIGIGLTATQLVALRLNQIVVMDQDIRLGQRDLSGPTIAHVQRYWRHRCQETGGMLDAPLFVGTGGKPISASYARRLLHQVAQSVGLPGSLLRGVREQLGGTGNW